MPYAQPQDLRERRSALGLSRQQLAALAGVSIGSVTNYEGGWRPVTGQQHVLDAIENALASAEAAARQAAA